MTASENDIRELLGSIVGPELAADAGDEEQLFERGIVDSLQLLELVATLESRYGFHIEGDELLPENFGSVRAMTSYVNRKARG
jgi:acyl carrier protein